MSRRPILPLCVGAAVLAAATASPAMTDLGLPLASAAAVTYAVGAAILALRFPADLAAFGAANAITLARFVVVCLFAGLAAALVTGANVAIQTVWGFYILGVSAFLADGFDGWIARRTNTMSAYGARFDMETDAFFVLILGVVVWKLEKAGAWVILGGAARYAYVMAGIAIPALAKPLPPSLRRKATAVIQIGTLVMLVIPLLVPPVSTVLALTALVLLLASFAVDIRYQLRAPPLQAAIE